MDLVPNVREAVELGAVDPAFYSKFFFPRTVRQEVPHFHRRMWEDLDDPLARYVAFKVFRGGGKTTLLRLFTSRRVAYGVSHTIVYTSNSELHAARSVRWIRKQIEYNRLWAEAFGLRKGAKWTDSELEILHGVEEFPITIIAVGITGQVRGINVDDYRPDLVVADDVDNEETTGTAEQRKKSSDLLFGALINSMAPRSEALNAKFALAQTPLADGDQIDIASKDPAFRTANFPCFTEDGESRWEERFPLAELRKEKEEYIRRGQLSLWMRERECKIIGAELASFRRVWAKTYDVLPEGGWYRISIDPAFSDSPSADDTAIAVIYFHGKKRFLVEYSLDRGLEPDATIAKLFGAIYRFNPRQIVIETVAAQRILSWFLRQAMQHQRRYVPIVEHDDKRRKADIILQSFLAVAPPGNFYCKESHIEFLEAFSTWYPGYSGKDDLLDAIARGMTAGFLYDDSANDVAFQDDEEMKPLEWKRPAP